MKERLKERPIIFSAPMVKALLAGTKTQTRRIIKPEWLRCLDPGEDEDREKTRIGCPYGIVGDHLWVKENFRLRADQDDKPPSQDWWKKGAWYAADPDSEPSGCQGGAGKLRPSIFMPRWASRITLEITDVRVEPLQSISRDDAADEGIPQTAGEADALGLFDLSKEHGYEWDNRSTIENYARLWDEINSDRTLWNANPWVWAITFRYDRPKERS